MAAGSPLLFLSIVLIVVLLPASNAIYCDEDDCYDLLGFCARRRLKQDANASEIRKAYYKLSLIHHPDKNPDPESRKLFVKIANAYEILKDESTREQYDYAIAHPEEVFYNTAQYYRAYYGHKMDPRAVLIGLLLIISAFQYINQLTRYSQAIESVKQTPAYRNRLKALEFERTGGIASKKKGYKQVDKDMESDIIALCMMISACIKVLSVDIIHGTIFQNMKRDLLVDHISLNWKVEVELINEVELQIHGVEKPSVWKLYGVQFVLLPYYIGKMLIWEICWFWRYRVKKLPYAWEDACYLTQTSVKIPVNTWKNMDESTKENLVTRRLWERSNMERYMAEMRKESKRRR
ncbi:hypothetical protein PR202_ga31349 [Eleusine coracana subsp. coracana]|uniref:J domain-containing protein n=1 Tax=Eleusine coracana subsp. coracana TaxID=191504 RepID=A0AAV5DRZ3_ELECO|nr:hypothetical protein PR202_ga31349 [Eleusine coracana subsp. coracana]